MSRLAKPIRRRAMLAGVAGAAGLLPVLGAQAQTASPPRYGNTRPTTVRYRGRPHKGHDCSNCRFFIPAADPMQPGHCQVVAGLVSPHGWCDVWGPRS
jgi:High potential iron-sulfur protein